MRNTPFKTKLLLTAIVSAGTISSPQFAYATCSPAGTEGDDIIICDNLSVNGDIDTLGGNDRITVESGSSIDDLLLGAGNDTGIFDNATIKSLNSNGGEDDLTLTNDTEIIFDVHTGENDDVLTILNSIIDGTLFMESGDDTATFTDSMALSIDLGDGEDEITLTDESEVVFDIHTGEGADQLTITDSLIDGTLFMEGDDDIATFTNSTADSADLGNGADEITLTGVSAITGLLRSGQNTSDDGADTLTITGGSTVGATFTGFGDDILTITDSTITGVVFMEDGNDTSTLTNATIRHISLGEGSDEITLQSGSQVTTALIAGESTINDGNDVVTITNGSSVGTQIDLGFGADIITIEEAGTIGTSLITGGNVVGDGNDTVTITGGSTIGTDVNTGFGDDIVTITDSTIGRNLSMQDGADTATVTNSIIRHIDLGNDADEIMLKGGSEVETSIITGADTADDGDDIITLMEGSFGDKSLSTGGGSDTVTLEDESIITTFILTGINTAIDGIDTVTIKDGSTVGTDVTTGFGADVVALEGASTIGGNLATEDGADQITITGLSIINGSLLSGAGDDVITVLGDSEIGKTNAADAHTIDAGDGNDTVEIDGIVTGYVDLGNGDDTIILDSHLVINTSNTFAVYGGDGEDIITVDGGQYSAGISGGNDDDVLTINDGEVTIIDGGAGDDLIAFNNGETEHIYGDEGDDTIELFGGTITEALGVRGGFGDDELIVDPTQSDAELDLTAVHFFEGGDGTDTATFKNIQTGTHILENFRLTQWADVTFEESRIDMDNSVFVAAVNLINNTILTQKDGNLILDNGVSETRLSVDGTSQIDLQDGVADDRITNVKFLPEAGSQLLVDVDVAASGFDANASDYIEGDVTHTPESGTIVNVNLLNTASLSGSRQIVKSSAETLSVPEDDTPPDPSSTYILANDPSTEGRKYWLEDDGQGGVYLLWTTPVDENTSSGFMGNGSGSGDAKDRDGAGAVDIMVATHGGAGAALDNIARLAAQSGGSFTADRPNQANNGGTSYEIGKTTAWTAGSLASTRFGGVKGHSHNASFGLERDIGDVFGTSAGRMAVGAFGYIGEVDVDLMAGSKSEVDSLGGGVYVRAASESGYYGALSAYNGHNEIEVANGVLDTEADFNSNVWSLNAVGGKIIPLSSRLKADLRATFAHTRSDTDKFKDSAGFKVSGIDGKSNAYTATAGLNYATGNLGWVYARAGVKRISARSKLEAYDETVTTRPHYTTGTGEIGFNGKITDNTRLELAAFGEKGSKVEVYGAKIRLEWLF